MAVVVLESVAFIKDDYLQVYLHTFDAFHCKSSLSERINNHFYATMINEDFNNP